MLQLKPSEPNLEFWRMLPPRPAFRQPLSHVKPKPQAVLRPFPIPVPLQRIHTQHRNRHQPNHILQTAESPSYLHHGPSKRSPRNAARVRQGRPPISHTLQQAYVDSISALTGRQLRVVEHELMSRICSR